MTTSGALPPGKAPADSPASDVRPLTAGVVLGSASQITVAVVGAITTLVVARMLGPDGLGVFALAQAVLVVGTVLSSLGVEHGIAYYVASHRWPPSAAWRSAVAMAFAAGAVAALAAVGFRLVVPAAFETLSVWLLAALVATLPFALSWFFVRSVAVAIDRYEVYAAFPTALAALTLALAVTGAAWKNANGAVLGLAIATALVGIAAIVWARSALPDHRGNAEAGMLRRATRFGIKGYSANALQLLNYRLDLFILAAVATAADVGRYSIAIAAASLLWIVPNALGEVLLPRVARLSSDADDVQRELVEVKSLRHVILAMLVTTAGLALALVLLTVPILGPGFQPSVELGLILLPGAALLGIAGVMVSTVVGRGRPGLSLLIAGITTPITAIAYAVLIPRYEATGAAVASTFSYALSFALAWLFYRRVTGRRGVGVLVPTRSELSDYRALRSAVLGRARPSR